MADVYSTVTDLDDGTLDRLINAMEVRAAQPAQQEMLRSYLSEVSFPVGARVLEVGSGSGAIARMLASWPNVGEVVGIDPSPHFVAKARELGAGIAGLTFGEGDGRFLQYEDASFDVVVVHTVLSHVPGPESVVAEAYRVLKRGGMIALFDGDYSTPTVAQGEFDPLQTCVDAAFSALANDRWVVRRLPWMATQAGFAVRSFRSHGYVETDAAYVLTLVDRGADFLADWGRISANLAAALKREARDRIERGTFFGHIAFASLVATKAL